MTRTRQVILIVLLLFAAYAIYTSPAASADAVRAVWNVIVSAVEAIFRFFDELIH